jgi:hypothetical protein
VSSQSAGKGPSVAGAPSRIPGAPHGSHRLTTDPQQNPRHRPLSPPRGRTRLCLLGVAGLLALAALLPTTVAASAYPARAAGYGISLSARPDGILISQPVSFTGVVPAGYAGGSVRLRRLVGLRWLLIGVDRDIAPGGGFAITHVFGLPTRPHELTWLRLCFRTTGRPLHTCSASFAVRISRSAKPREHQLSRALARERREQRRRALEAARRQRRESARDRRLQRDERQATERRARHARALEEARKRREEARQAREGARKHLAELRRGRRLESEERRRQHRREQAEKHKRQQEEVRLRKEQAHKAKEAHRK